MTTMQAIEKKMEQTLANATGVKVTVEYVKVMHYFFIEWEGNDQMVSESINKCFRGKCEDFDYDDEFNFSSCYVRI